MRHLPLVILSTFIFSAGFISKNRKITETNISIVHNDRASSLIDTTKEQGKKIFYASCYTCHKDSGTSLAPGQTILTAMTPRAVYAALNTGKMRQQAANLSETERKAVAYWLTNAQVIETNFPKDAYTNFAITGKESVTFDHSGWGNNLEGTGY